MKKWENRDLAQRFVSDYNLPIPIINEDLFNYHLCLYNKVYGSLDKWKLLLNLINNKFKGDKNLFLDEYYQIRDKIINSVKKTDAFLKFDNSTYASYTIPEDITSKNVYAQDNIGKIFISIDITKANFQILRETDKDIVFGADTYEDFVGKFTDLDYFKESKYTRQVIFGNLNPKKQIAREKSFTLRMYEMLKSYAISHEWKQVSVSNDEIVYAVTKASCNKNEIIKLIKEKLGIEVKVNMYRLDGYKLNFRDSGHEKLTFYTKTDMFNGKVRFVSVPLQYHSIIFKHYYGLPTCNEDYHFNYEGIDCIFNEEFVIKKIEP